MLYGSWDMERDRHNFLSFWTIFCPFTPLSKFLKYEKNTWRYYQFTNVYHKWQSYDVWLLRYGVQQIEFFVVLARFLPCYPPNNPKNQNFEKMKKPPGNIIILHRCNINDNHMMYCSWDTKHDGQNVLLFWTSFRTFTPLTIPKIKMLKK